LVEAVAAELQVEAFACPVVVEVVGVEELLLVRMELEHRLRVRIGWEL
jgi:hypothetical protein